MSIDLDVKIRKGCLLISDVINVISSHWDALQTGEAVTILNASELDLGQALSSECPPIDIEVTEEAYVRCLIFDVEQWPPDSEDHDECGLLCGFSAGIRNNETKLLMSVAAAAVAELAGSKIIDEHRLAGQGRIVSAQAFLEKIGRVTGRRLADAANAFAPEAS